jgi:hypothetical protein
MVDIEAHSRMEARLRAVGIRDELDPSEVATVEIEGEKCPVWIVTGAMPSIENEDVETDDDEEVSE